MSGADVKRQVEAWVGNGKCVPISFAQDGGPELLAALAPCTILTREEREEVERFVARSFRSEHERQHILSLLTPDEPREGEGGDE